MINARFLRSVLLKGLVLFLVFNLLWAFFPPAALGNLSLYNSLLRGRERFPFGENPAESYNLSLYNLDAMFASHKLDGAPKPADEFRVIVIGDSSAWGTLLRPQETLAGLLDSSNLRSADGRNVRVYNLGYPTLSLTKDLMILEQALTYDPDYILWPLTLQSFPRDRQLESPILANNPRRAASLISRFNLDLPLPETVTSFWSRTLAGQRRDLADLLRLQFYGVMWSATGIDQTYPTDYTPAALDLEANASFNGWQSVFPDNALALDVLSAGVQLAGDVPILLINEPILISSGVNSHVRYNFYYPRWAFDQYREQLQNLVDENGWNYLDLWDLVLPEHFTNSAIHLDPQGEILFADAITSAFAESDSTK